MPDTDGVLAAIDACLHDSLLRISMPDSTESLHRVVAVAPGETPGSYVMTLEPAETPALPPEETT